MFGDAWCQLTCAAVHLPVGGRDRLPGLLINQKLLLLQAKVLSLLHIAFSVKAAVLNVHSVRNKGDTIKDYIADNKLEIVALTETWLSNDDGDQRYVKKMTPSGYKWVHKPRKGRGGGVALL